MKPDKNIMKKMQFQKRVFAGGLSAARHAKFELVIFQNIKIKSKIVITKVSS